MNPDWRSRYEVAIDAAKKAGQLALKYFDADVAVEWKADKSPVTVADREAEALLRSTLLGKFPHDGFLGEESGYTAGTTGFRWIIDPIDGTRNFVRGVPIWATLVGLEYNDDQIAGVAEIPALGQTWRALAEGATAPTAATAGCMCPTRTLAESILFTSMSWFMKADREAAFIELVKLTYQQRRLRRFLRPSARGPGVARSWSNTASMPFWDVAAIKPIVEKREAAGATGPAPARSSAPTS